MAQWNDKVLIPVPLENMAFFKPADANWSIQGDAMGLPGTQYHLVTKPGTGMLVNQPSPGKNSNLISAEEYGDLDLQFDFLMPKGSNSGIYLMGRYEVQLNDAWGIRNPAFSDCGGIYQRWDPSKSAGNEGFEGVPPLVNASRAPGLWQTMKISFEAPRFSSEGKKIANARMISVWLNGVRIHSNVELTGPTRGPLSVREAAKGPVLIQGDHGPVAFRNLKYGPAGNPLIELKDMQFQVYQGAFRTVEDFQKKPPVRSGKAVQFDRADAETSDDFLLAYNGKMRVQTPGTYTFSLELSGKGILKIDGKLLLDTTKGGFWWQKRDVNLELSVGEHPFELLYMKSNPEGRPSLGVTYWGPGIRLQRLHSDGSLNAYLPGGQQSLPLEPEPFVQRSFFNHKGIRKPYGLTVCDPSGIHYSLNVTTGRVLRAWRGNVCGEVNSMWVDRGSEQTLIPRNPVVELPEMALFGFGSESNVYPDTLKEEDGFRYLGYKEKPGEKPEFEYKTQEGIATLKLIPSENRLVTKIRINSAAESTRSIWHGLAQGESVEKLSDGSYRIDGIYYLIPDPGISPLIKEETKGKMKRLLVPVSGKNKEINYSIVW